MFPVLCNGNNVIRFEMVRLMSEHSSSYFALLGTNVLTDADKRVARRLCRVAVHKRFQISSFQNDVAVAELSGPVDLTSRFINTICLPTAASRSAVSWQYS